MAVERVTVHDVRERMQSDPDLLLVCAYDSDEKFEQNHLAGAMSLSEFQSRADEFSKDQEVVFYCA